MTKKSKDNDFKKKEFWDSTIVGFFLIGLAILFYLGVFWPWIIALVGLTLIIKGIKNYYSKTRS
jgi:CHASE2 domain-containing sensor protein